MKNIFYLTFFSIVLFSCGPSAEEKAATEKIKMDSIATATEAATKQKIETKLALQDSITNAMAQQEGLENLLTYTKGKLAGEKDKMGRIKEWQLGRTPAEREQQIENQTMLIDEAEKEISNLEQAIEKLTEKIKNFQTELKQYEG